MAALRDIGSDLARGDTGGGAYGKRLRRTQMAAQAEIAVTGDQHLLIDRAVRIVAGDATFTHRTVFIDEGSFLLGVALRAGGVHTFEVEAGATDRIALMDFMAIGAAHLAVHDLVAVREAELRALVQVTLEASLGRLGGIDDRAATAAGGDVDTAGAVTGFATGVAELRIRNREAGVARGFKMVGLVFVTLGTLF